jgi:hypothetical protein
VNTGKADPPLRASERTGLPANVSAVVLQMDDHLTYPEPAEEEAGRCLRLAGLNAAWELRYLVEPEYDDEDGHTQSHEMTLKHPGSRGGSNP